MNARDRINSRLRSFSRYISAITFLVGLLVLVGWIFNVSVLKGVLPGLVTMKANTALSFMLLGVSLWLLVPEQSSQGVRSIARVCASVGAVIGTLTLSEYIFGWNLGIDQLLFQEPVGAIGTFRPGRMAPNAALNFIMLGLALLLLDVETRHGHRPAQFLALVATLVGLLSLTGYAFGVRALYGISSYTEMALHTSVTFIVLSLGVLFARPYNGLMDIVTSENAGSFMLRRILPVAIVLPLLLGWVRLGGEQLGLYDTKFGVALFSVILIVVLSVVVWMNAVLQNRIDIECKRTEEDLRKYREQLEELVEQRTAELKASNEELLQEITNRRWAEEQVQCQLDRVNTLHSIDMAITSSLDLHVTLNVFLDQVTDKLNVDAADILLLDPHTQALQYTTGRGFRTTALQHTSLRLGRGHAGRAALERSIINVPNLSQELNDLKRAPLLGKEDFVSYYAVPLIAKGHVLGILEIFHRSQLQPEQDWLDFLKALASQAAIAIDNASLFDELQRSNVELILAYDNTIEGWSKALDLRDEDTEGHSQRVTNMTIKIARTIGMSETELVHVRRGALLHDIGKMGIPDSILLKPSPLTEEEWEVMRKHPVYAYEMLSPIAFLRQSLDIPYCHHERWDGTGYPRGLKGEQIPLAARIFKVVDVWDALRSERPYRPAWQEEKAKEYIHQEAGKHFDPKVVEVFLEALTWAL